MDLRSARHGLTSRGYGRHALVTGLLLAFTTLSGVAFEQGGTQASRNVFDTPRTGSFAGRSPAGGVLRLISWNIDRGYEFDRVAGTLREKQPDLCLLQEVDLNA